MDQSTVDKYLAAAEHIYLMAKFRADDHCLPLTVVLENDDRLESQHLADLQKRFQDDSELSTRVHDFEGYLLQKMNLFFTREAVSGYELAAKYVWQNAVLFDIIHRKADNGTEGDALRDAMDEYCYSPNVSGELYQKVEEFRLWFHSKMLPEDKSISPPPR